MEYKDRLALAMKDAGKNESELAGSLKVSYQAIKKVLAGTTNALTAANNSNAAKFLGVDSHWLATGNGQQKPQQAHAAAPAAPSSLAGRAAALIDDLPPWHQELAYAALVNAINRIQHGVDLPAGDVAAAPVSVPSPRKSPTRAR